MIGTIIKNEFSEKYCNYCLIPVSDSTDIGVQCARCIINDRNSSSKEIIAKKFDDGKSRVDLIPGSALEVIGHVLAKGAKKYEAHNWRKGSGLEWSRLLGAALRHLYAWGRGENIDEETGLSHLAHAACCILFLLTYEQEGGGTDDRYK